MDRQQPTGCLDTAGEGALSSDQHDIGGLPPVSGQQFVAAGDTVDSLDRGNGPHHPGQAIASATALVANQHAGHVVPPADGMDGCSAAVLTGPPAPCPTIDRRYVPE